jgi:hypothetical protein
MDKGSYLMAKCDTDAEANERYNRLLAIGLDPKIIHIHPDNVADPAETLIAAKQYGVEAMGSPKFLAILRKTPRLSAPGLDRLRYEHLRTLTECNRGQEASAEATRFTQMYVQILNLIINGHVPEAIQPLLRDNQLFAAYKKENDERPLGFCGVHRKLAD